MNFRVIGSEVVRITSYQFGRIVIDGIAYNSDCLILGETVHANWRRKQGHLLCPEDLQPVVEAGPSTLIVGCGSSSMMQISKDLPQFLQELNITLEAFDTHEAVGRVNELSKAGKKVAAALHLTC
jgi:hypothetical protein